MSSIIRPADLNSFMQKTLPDGLAKQVCDAVNAYIERTTNRCWGDTVSVTETHRGYRRTIWLRHQDVRQVSSVSFGYFGSATAEIVSDAYDWDELGRLMFYGRGFGFTYADLPRRVVV